MRSSAVSTLGVREWNGWLRWKYAAVAVSIAAAVTACGDDIIDPAEVQLGETTFVFVVNPAVNDANAESVATPGTSQSGVDVSIQDGLSWQTDLRGVVALAPVDAGTRTVSFSDAGGNTGELSLDIANRDLLEVAVALDESGATKMVDLRYAFAGNIVEITSEMSVADVNEGLSESNAIVLIRGGTYVGDVEFSGSNVTLFGEGPAGGKVTIDGDVIVSGSGNRVRGAQILGDLSVPGSDVGVSFSSVAGSLTVDGSDAVLLRNSFCGPVTIEGSGTTALGNAGMAPLSAPSDGC